MPNPHRCWLVLMVLTLPLATGCAPRPRPAPPPYSSDPKLIPKLDPILALPQHPRPTPNGYEVFGNLVKKINRGHELKADFSSATYHAPSREEELAAAPAQLADNREVLAELRQALRMEWLCPHPPKADLNFPELSSGRYLAKLLKWEAALREQSGDAEGAMGDLVDILTLKAKMQRGGSDLHWLVGRSYEALAFAELLGLIAHHRLPPKALTALAQQLRVLERQRVPLREMIAFSYECQGPQTLSLTPVQFVELLSERGPPLWMRVALHLPRAGAVIRSYIAGHLPELMAWDAKLARLSTQPYHLIRGQVPAPRAGDDARLVLYPFPETSLAQQAESQTKWRAAQIMIALELHRNRRGAYPPSLKALTGLTAEQLQDPFSGKPLVYRPKGDSYTLYSVGQDGEDNGGRATKRPADPHTDVVVWPARTD